MAIMNMQTTSLFEFGPFRLDTVRRLLLQDQAVVALPPKAFDTLLVLVENCDRVLEKSELMSVVWPNSFVEEANLTQTVSILRKALGERAGEHRYIVTVPGRGYRFVASVKQLAGAALIIERHTRSQAVIEGESEANKPPRTIAVLPFKPLGAGAADEYLGLGLADSLVTRLSNMRQIIVRPTSSILKYTGALQDPVAAGRELKVEAVLDASIRRSSDRIRVTVQLVSVRDEVSLWAGTFDERFTDIFALEDSISSQVVDALMLKLSGEEREQLAKHHTENAAAYELYLKGRYYWNKRTIEGTKKGVECFAQAIAIDQNYARAYAGLADCYTKLGDVGITSIPPKEAFSKAKAAAARAGNRW
jgi:DNA-binding winged helix-turn-helix (wHTH) protein